MSIHELDSFEHEVQAQRLFQECERAIYEYNHDHIARVTGGVSKEAFLRVAEEVARLRAAYLKEVLRLAEPAETDSGLVDSIHRHRLAYEEALQGFGALRHAYKRGYFQVDGAD